MPTIPILTIEDVPDERLSAFYRLWLTKQGRNRYPSRRDFDILEWRRWLHHIFIIEVRRNPFDLKLRLVGTATTQVLGVELTGRSLPQALKTCELIRSIDETLSDFVECAQTGAVRYREDRVPMRAKEMVRFRYLLLPLAADGAIVDQILGVAYYQLAPNGSFNYRL